jgi:hypothetical protein
MQSCNTLWSSNYNLSVYCDGYNDGVQCYESPTNTTDPTFTATGKDGCYFRKVSGSTNQYEYYNTGNGQGSTNYATGSVKTQKCAGQTTWHYKQYSCS